MLTKWEKLSRDHPPVVKMTFTFADYIALDVQPLSVVEGSGFWLFCILQPNWRCEPYPYHSHGVTEARALPHTFGVSSMSLISMTTHGIDDVFKLQSHPACTIQRLAKLGQAIADKMVMLQTWSICNSAVHVALSDNTKNKV